VNRGDEAWHGAYSQDLRDRVIDAALGGLPARQAAARFRIGLATAIRWVRQARETGDRRPGRQGKPRRCKLDLHRDYILGQIEAEPDITISEMLDKLASERGVRAARATLWTFLDRCGLTFKKRLRTRPSRSARIS
jgi:transposase